VPGVLKVLLERLRNEITRLPAVKGFAVLAHSKLDLGLDGALEPVIVSIVTVLRLADTLTCVLLHCVVKAPGIFSLVAVGVARELCALEASPAV
jgi:hypothetical protein